MFQWARKHFYPDWELALYLLVRLLRVKMGQQNIQTEQEAGPQPTWTTRTTRARPVLSTPQAETVILSREAAS